MESLLLLGSGILLGLGHAFEADHVAAVSSFAGTTRSRRQVLALSLSWGLGHAATLLLLAGIIVLSKWTFPHALELTCEFMVALMLLGLGLWAIKNALTITHDEQTKKQDDGDVNTNANGKVSGHSWRCFGIGVVHGCAGSAALLILACEHLQSPWWQLAYVAIFAVGAIAGMMIFSGAVLIPLCMQQRYIAKFISIAAGFVSVGVGIYLGIKVACFDGLF
ncbi:MAG: hypothetical protein HRU15_11265 [Planctomycetes bacterium]|nr:hypothetical protein [Planctomycetota bacterium]